VDLTKPNQNITFKVGATNSELQRAIEAALPAAMAQTKDLAKRFKGSTEKESCQKIFSFLMSDITYKVDGDNQKIKLPSAFLREKSGDCKSYSLFTGAILSNLKIPFNFTYASYNPTDKTPEHIYVTTKSGCIIDAVYGKFNAEKKPTYKYQKPMNISYISGVKNHTEKYENQKENYSNIGNIFGKNHSPKIGASHDKGIGRTGYDWAKAVGIDKYYDFYKWFGKSTLSPALGLSRIAVRTSLSKNGGGLANYLWSISPFNNQDKEDTAKKALYLGEMEIITRDLIKKYPDQWNYKVTVTPLPTNPLPINAPVTAQAITFESAYNGPLNVVLNFPFTQLESAEISAYFKKNKVDFSSAVKAILMPGRYREYVEFQTRKIEQQKRLDAYIGKKTAYFKELEAAKLKVYAKYPYILSRKSTPKLQEAYRKLETWYFWELGGNPDDLNNAVMEGNKKTPTGETFNYYIQERLKGRDLGIAFGLKASISALFGYKYDPDTSQIIDPTTNKAINGVKNGIGEATILTIIATILAWIGTFPIYMQVIIFILLVLVGGLLILAIFAPEIFNNIFGLPQTTTNSTTVNPAPYEPPIDELTNPSWTQYLVPAGIAAAVLLYAK
jgi:hypothetical protein